MQSLLSTEYDKKGEGVFTIRVDECTPSCQSFFAAADFCYSEFTAKKNEFSKDCIPFIVFFFICMSREVEAYRGACATT